MQNLQEKSDTLLPKTLDILSGKTSYNYQDLKNGDNFRVQTLSGLCCRSERFETMFIYRLPQSIGKLYWPCPCPCVILATGNMVDHLYMG